MSIRDDLKAYQDGELSPERMEEVRVALTQDEALQKEYEFMKFLSSEIKAAAKDPAIQGRPAEVPLVAPQKKKWGAMQWSLATAAGAATIAMLGLIGPKLGPTASTDSEAKYSSTAAMAASVDATKVDAPEDVSKGLKKSVVPPGGGVAAGEPAPNSTTDAKTSGWSQPVPGSQFGDPTGTAASPAAPSAQAAPSTPIVADDSVATTTPATSADAVRGGAATPTTGIPESNAKAKTPMALSIESGQGRAGGAYRAFGTPAPAQITPSAPEQIPAYMHDIVRTASEEIKVKNVRDAVDEVTKNVTAMQGFIGQSNQSMTDGNSVATLHVQVPSAAYDSFIISLHHMGDLISEHATGTDVTGQEINNDAQNNATKDELTSLQKDLQNARSSYDKENIRDKIRQVQAQINMLTAQQKDIKLQAQYASFDLTFREKVDGHGQSGDWFNESLSGSGEILGFAGSAFGRGLVYLLVLSPIWLPIAGLIWWFNKKNKKA